MANRWREWIEGMVLTELEQGARVLVAAALGAVVGWQREHVGRAAGIRTFAAVSFGACVFGLLDGPEMRIAAQVVTGVGFLGAGIIMRDQGRITGLTTAASLWAISAVGLMVAHGRLLLATMIAGLLLGLLSIPMKHWERPTPTLPESKKII